MSLLFRAKLGLYRQLSKAYPVLQAKQPFFNIEQLSASSKSIILILLSLLAVTPRLFFIDVPFERDEGVYAYISDVIDRGGIPYRDAFDHKPPLIYYIYNVSFALFGHSIIAPRLMAVLFTAIACLYVFLIVYHITHNKIAGVLSMMFLGLSSASPVYSGFNTNTEIFTLPFLAAGSYYLMIAERRLRYFLLSGLLFGFALITKQVVIAIAIPALLACSYYYKNKLFHFYKPACCFLIGLSSPFIFFVLYFIYHDSLSFFLDYCFTYNIDYATTLSPSHAFTLLSSQIGMIRNTDIIIWTIFLISFIFFIRSSTLFFYRLLIINLLIGSMIAIAMGRYFYGHYFIVILPFMGITIGLFANISFKKIKLHVIQICLFSIYIISLFLYSPYFRLSNANLIEHINGTSNPFYQSVAVGEFLKKRAQPQSTAYILGSEAQILFYSGLKSASSIFYFYPLMQPSLIQKIIRQKTLADIRRNSPSYVIQVNSLNSTLLTDYTDPFIIELFTLLNDYHPIAISLFNSDTVTTKPEVIDAVARTTPDGSIIIYEKNSLVKK